MSEGLYLFCLTSKNPSVAIEGAGIDGIHPLETLEEDDLTAIFSKVSLEDFCGQEARERLADLAWVAPRALRHEDVIMCVMRQSPVLPVRFGSVFSSKNALESLLRQHKEVLLKFFIDTDRQKEWNLKAYVNMPQTRLRVMETHLAAAKEQLDKLTPGIRHFQEQKIKGALEHEVASWLKERAQTLMISLKEVSTAFCECHLLSPELTGRGDEMFFNAALLVPESSEAQLQQLMTELSALHEPMGLHFESFGPLPPYHFTPALDMKG
jgi:hypothetical protein